MQPRQRLRPRSRGCRYVQPRNRDARADCDGRLPAPRPGCNLDAHTEPFADLDTPRRPLQRPRHRRPAQPPAPRSRPPNSARSCSRRSARSSGENELEARALDLGLRDADGAYWAVLTNGLRPFYVNDDGDPINFFHLVAVHRLNKRRIMVR